MNQMAMSLPANESFAAQDYMLTASNQNAWNLLMCWPNWPDYAMWLYGPAHSGKSHLAHIWAQRAGAKLLNNAQQWRGALRENIAAQCFLIDTLPALDEADCSALFHLLNHVKTSGAQLLIVCKHSPSAFAAPLPDLHSRLRALPTAQLSAPDDDLLRAVWFKRFADRQLQVSPAVIDYLLAHTDRSFSAIHHATCQLDRAALEQQRPITIPLVKEVL